jgi:HK97 family phage portal protein
MSILGRFVARGGTGGLEQRTITSSSFVPPPSTGVLDDYVGVHKAMANLTVMACVRLLADTIAALPWKAYRRDSNGIPVEINPQPALLRSPFPGFDLFQYKWMMVASLALRGNFYGLVTQRDSALRPTALMPLHPDIVFLERRPDILMWFDPVYRVMGEQISSEDVVHIRRFTMAGEPYGLSPVRQAAVAIGMSLAAEEYGYRYFKESANPSGLLTTDQNLDDEAVTRQQKNWIASHGGRRMPAVLTGGFKFETLGIAPDESQFLETRKFQRSEISMMYGIPPHMIGDVEKSTSWGTGIEEQTIGAITYTFRAWSSPIESVLSAMLPQGQYVRFDYKALLRGDLKARYEAYDKALHSGWINVNEIRAEEELEPIGPDGDIYLQPVNYAPLGFTPVASQPSTPGAPKPEPKKPRNPGPKGVAPIAGGEHEGGDRIAAGLALTHGFDFPVPNGRPVDVGS